MIAKVDDDLDLCCRTTSPAPGSIVWKSDHDTFDMHIVKPISVDLLRELLADASMDGA